jgi:tetratricopeptide (TPR) repeat protein
VLGYLSVLHTMRGDFDLARDFAGRSLGATGEDSVQPLVVRAFCLGWFVEAKSGNWADAEREVRHGYDGLAALGNTAFRSTIAAMLAHCLERLGRLDEADRFVTVCTETAARDDAISQMLWRTARARLLASRGEPTEAVSLAREAVAIALETDALPYQGDVLLDLAEVLVAAGRDREGHAAARDALAAYRRKEYLNGVTRAEALLGRLETRDERLALREDVRRVSADEADREEMRMTREQLADLAPRPRD